jgi:hypothetical protein
MRDATLMLVNLTEYGLMNTEEARALHKELREWYLKQWDATEKLLDVPF